MACPHVTGVVAQLLQKNSTATPKEVSRALACDAGKGEKRNKEINRIIGSVGNDH